MTRIKFIYAHGTAYLMNILETGFGISQDLKVFNGPVYRPDTQTYATVAGLNGKTVVWDALPQSDPFPFMLDPDLFDAVRIEYSASMIPMNYSVNSGIEQVKAIVNSLPPSQPWMIGGYSQGAVVCSSIYNETRYGTLTSRNSTFLGGVMFGNPRRQLNYRGSVGGTWSGTLDNPNASTGGSGVFPTSGPYALLTSCEPSRWIELSHPLDIFSSVGYSVGEQLYRSAAAAMINMDAASLIAYCATGLPGVLAALNYLSIGGAVNEFIDAAGNLFKVGGKGHTAYAFIPPEGNPDGNLTSYQIALKFLTDRAKLYQTAPEALTSTSAGWSETLLPPAT